MKLEGFFFCMLITDQGFRVELLSHWLDYYLSNAVWRLFTHNQVEVVVEVEAEVKVQAEVEAEVEVQAEVEAEVGVS